MKTSTDSKGSNRSDEFKKCTFACEIFDKNANFLLSGRDFLEFFQKIPFTLPCELFRNFFWLGLAYV